jgi:hypothetical protein
MQVDVEQKRKKQKDADLEAIKKWRKERKKSGGMFNNPCYIYPCYFYVKMCPKVTNWENFFSFCHLSLCPLQSNLFLSLPVSQFFPICHFEHIFTF